MVTTENARAAYAAGIENEKVMKLRDEQCAQGPAPFIARENAPEERPTFEAGCPSSS